MAGRRRGIAWRDGLASPPVTDAYDIATAALRRLPPERAHQAALWALSHGLAPKRSADDEPTLATRVWNADFANPIGIAAGFDKRAIAIDGALGLGAGFIEVGGITPLPQRGNPKPRLFRLPGNRALINRMGFNNDGLDAVAARLAARDPRVRPGGRRGRVGVNLASNTDSADPAADFETLVRACAPLADFLTVDVSCPNTANGQLFLAPQPLADLLGRLRLARAAVDAAATPLVVKLSPDIEAPALDAIVATIVGAGVDGIVVCNTTTARPTTLRGPRRRERGGLSGAPLRDRALAMLRQVYERTQGRLPLVGVGGIASGADAYARIRAGADLVQLYTALVYDGPGLVGRIKRDVAACLARDGFADVAAAVGADHRSPAVTAA